jgi:hypothetical protein
LQTPFGNAIPSIIHKMHLLRCPSSFQTYIIPSEIALLPSERAALCETCLATSWLAQDLRASLANDNGLSVREDGGDCEAAWALDVHEE